MTWKEKFELRSQSVRAADSRVDGKESRSRGSNTDTSSCSMRLGLDRNTGQRYNGSINLAVEGGQDPP